MFAKVGKALDDKDLTRAAKLAKACGLEVSVKQLEQLTSALSKANGTRQVRLLAAPQLFDAIEAALADPLGLGIVHGGEGNDGMSHTTLCLAFRQGASITVGVAPSRARDAGPGVTWRELQPWSKRAFDRNIERLQTWAKHRADDRISFRVATHRASPKPAPAQSEAALLAAVLADPDDDGPRAVYADALAARGDPRGELITVQLALAKAKPGSTRHRELASRSAELEQRHAAAWSRALAQYTIRQRYRRGFVEYVELRSAAFAAHAEVLFALAPIEKVQLRGISPKELAKVGARPELARLRGLALKGDLAVPGAAAIAGALGALRELDLGECHPAPAALALLLEATPRLERIVMRLLPEELAARIAPYAQLRVVMDHPPRASGTSVKQLLARKRVLVMP